MVRVIRKARPATEPPVQRAANPWFTIVFHIDGREETVQVYENYAVYAGNCYCLDGIGPELGTNISAS